MQQPSAEGSSQAVAARAWPPALAASRRPARWRQVATPRFLIGGLLLAIIVAAVTLAPVLAPTRPEVQNLAEALQGPSRSHALGTDHLGRDVLSRVLYGGRYSIGIGTVSASIGLVLGTLIGLLAGTYGGWVDRLLMRVIDVMLAFPGLLVAIPVVAVLGAGLGSLILAVGIYSIPVFARIARNSSQVVAAQEYITAVQGFGAGTLWVIWHHVLPNILTPIIIIWTLRIGSAILVSSSLSFLGLGVQAPRPEWGVMLTDARIFLTTNPTLSLYPGLFLLATVLGFNLVGDALRDLFDPRLRSD